MSACKSFLHKAKFQLLCTVDNSSNVETGDYIGQTCKSVLHITASYIRVWFEFNSSIPEIGEEAKLVCCAGLFGNVDKRSSCPTPASCLRVSMAISENC
jgi:hypothetical protein